MADGTAQQCGRVGSCHIYLKSLSVYWKAFLFGITQQKIPNEKLICQLAADGTPALVRGTRTKAKE
jgi:hypothetical protein